MRLRDIAAKMTNAEVAGEGDPGILGITADSREARDGYLFAALPGTKADGLSFIPDAVRNGAAALLVEAIPSPRPVVPYIVVENARLGLGEVANIFYDYPSQVLDLIGVTGTNGKTTTAYLVRHIFNEAARRCGMLGTIEYDLGDRLEPAPLTTPDAVRFTRSLAEMRDFGCRTAVAEVSSHALAMDRVYPHRFAAAIFTNLTRDHLDYHGDMEQYLEAKRKLFLGLGDDAVAVVNYRDPAGARMAQGSKARVTGYRLAEPGEDVDLPRDAVRAEILSSSLDGQTFRIDWPGDPVEFRTPLVGRHNVENCLGAILAATALGVGRHTVCRAVESFPGVPGRLERIASQSGRRAFVDYAHTDDALRSVLSVLRPLAGGKLITVFGCGGDRDPGKRPLMAKAAEEFSDSVIVTSDNPRTEDPDTIIRDVMAGFSEPDKVVREPDRPAAILAAAKLAAPGDTILVAGKGHEDYQIVGTEKRHMDDRELVRDAFRRLSGRSLPERDRA